MDIDAVTAVEARAKAVVSRQFRDDTTLYALPFDGDQPPSFPPVAAVPAIDAAMARPRVGAIGSPDARPLIRPPSILGSLSALVALAALLFAVVSAGVTGIAWHATRAGALGNCARVGLCVGTPLATVEQDTGVRLPDGAELIRSTASRNGHYVAALVGLPAGVDAPRLPDGTSVSVTRRAASALRSASASDLRGSSAGPVALFVGTVDGRTIVFLRYDASDPSEEIAELRSP